MRYWEEVKKQNNELVEELIAKGHTQESTKSNAICHSFACLVTLTDSLVFCSALRIFFTFSSSCRYYHACIVPLISVFHLRTPRTFLFHTLRIGL